jgi:RNA recognition motif-containing protein
MAPSYSESICKNKKKTLAPKSRPHSPDVRPGRSKGFGFVEMSSQEEAQKAIDKVNGTDLEGRALTVNEAKPQAPRTGGEGGGGYGGGRDRW